MEDNREAALTLVLEMDPSVDGVLLLNAWNDCSCSFLPRGLDFFVVDTAVMCGVPATLRWLRLALRIPENAALSVTVQAAARQPVRPVILDLESYRKRGLRSKPGWVEHHTKWVNRTIRARKRACAMVREALAGAQAPS